MVYQSIQQQLPNISLGTVYRNLRFLVENGDAISLKLGDGREHFDGHLQPHYHFICSECGGIEDIFMMKFLYVLRLRNIVPVKYRDIALTFMVYAKIADQSINSKMIYIYI